MFVGGDLSGSVRAAARILGIEVLGSLTGNVSAGTDIPLTILVHRDIVGAQIQAGGDMNSVLAGARPPRCPRSREEEASWPRWSPPAVA